jgi:hydrogenase nickel incorporation protein HypA/HybF
MHELSIAMSIVEMAEEESERRGGAKISAVHLQLGLMSGVAKQALLSSYEMACESTVLVGSRLIIEEVAIQVFCPKCDAQRKIQSIQWFCCPECGTPTPEVLHGKELQVVALEIGE